MDPTAGAATPDPTVGNEANPAGVNGSCTTVPDASRIIKVPCGAPATCATIGPGCAAVAGRSGVAIVLPGAAGPCSIPGCNDAAGTSVKPGGSFANVGMVAAGAALEGTAGRAAKGAPAALAADKPASAVAGMTRPWFRVDAVVPGAAWPALATGAARAALAAVLPSTLVGPRPGTMN